MKSFSDVSLGLLVVLLIFVMVAMYNRSLTFCDEESEEEKNHALFQRYLSKPSTTITDQTIATLVSRAEKRSSKFEKLAHASSSGMIRGGIFGGLTGGIPGAVVGACVWGVVNPFIVATGF